MSNNRYPGLVAPLAPPNEVKLPFVRTGLHSYCVKYSYESRDGTRDEVRETIEAWSAADAVVQVAIFADGIGRDRCKILEVRPDGK